jgi:hypothetical protein
VLRLMSRGPWQVRASVVRRIIQAMKTAGLEVGRIEVALDGTLTITPRDGTSATTITPTDNVDEWKVA